MAKHPITLGEMARVVAKVDHLHDHVAVHEQQRKLREIVQAFAEVDAVVAAEGLR
jgi:hypothetical protein